MPPSLLLESLDLVWEMLHAISPTKAIAGGLALSFWGYPRSTRDIDIAILLSTDVSFKSFESKMTSLGLAPKHSLGAKQLGQLTVSQWLLPIPDAFVDIQVDLLLGDSEYFRHAMSRRVMCTLEGTSQEMQVLSCEDLVLFKSIAGRLIDLSDIRELLERNRASMDVEYLKTWATKLGVVIDGL